MTNEERKILKDCQHQGWVNYISRREGKIWISENSTGGGLCNFLAKVTNRDINLQGEPFYPSADNLFQFIKNGEVYPIKELLNNALYN